MSQWIMYDLTKDTTTFTYNDQFCRRPPDYDEYDIINFASGNTGI